MDNCQAFEHYDGYVLASMKKPLYGILLRQSIAFDRMPCLQYRQLQRGFENKVVLTLPTKGFFVEDRDMKHHAFFAVFNKIKDKKFKTTV